MDKQLLISIQPIHAKAIYEGRKRIELRRSLPKKSHGHLAFIYETAPMSMVTGWFRIGGFIHLKKDEFWKKFGLMTGITEDEFFYYFSGQECAHGIYIDSAHRLDITLSLKDFRLNRPPQSCRYINYHPYIDNDLFLLTLTL